MSGRVIVNLCRSNEASLKNMAFVLSERVSVGEIVRGTESVDEEEERVRVPDGRTIWSATVAPTAIKMESLDPLCTSA